MRDTSQDGSAGGVGNDAEAGVDESIQHSNNSNHAKNKNDANKAEKGSTDIKSSTSKKHLPSALRKIQDSLVSAGEKIEKVADSSKSATLDATSSLKKKTGDAFGKAKDSIATKVLRMQSTASTPAQETSERKVDIDVEEDDDDDSEAVQESNPSSLPTTPSGDSTTTGKENDDGGDEEVKKKDGDDEAPSHLTNNKTKKKTTPDASSGNNLQPRHSAPPPPAPLDPTIDTETVTFIGNTALGLFALVTVYLTLTNLTHIWTNQQVPVIVAVAWPLLAFVLGILMGFRLGAESVDPIKRPVAAALSEMVSASSSSTSSTDHQEQLQQEQGPVTFFQRTNKAFKKAFRIQSSSSSGGAPRLGSSMTRSTKKSWTTLGKLGGRKRLPWEKNGRERNGRPLVSRSLMRAIMLKHPDRSNKEEKDEVDDDNTAATVSPTDDIDDTVATLGSVDRNKMCATSLEDEVVEPLCPLRGLDIFLGDCAESDLANHPFLIKNGLRDRPTIVINLLTMWGNIAIYAELPTWLKHWDDIVENEEDDPEDVIALKRFVNADDEYRNLRLKCLPCLVDGPGPIRFLEPPRKPYPIITPKLPGRWTKHPGRHLRNEYLHPCLELELDMMVDARMRSVASLVKRYLVNLVMDAAILIEKPQAQAEEEPRACLGMCRFDRVDIATCPELPPRLEEGETVEGRDLRRASILVGIPLAT